VLTLAEQDMVERAELAGDLKCHTVLPGELTPDGVL
jgi:hypothetical protein